MSFPEASTGIIGRETSGGRETMSDRRSFVPAIHLEWGPKTTLADERRAIREANARAECFRVLGPLYTALCEKEISDMKAIERAKYAL